MESPATQVDPANSPLEPYHIYPEAKSCPVAKVGLWNGTPAHVFSGYEDVRTVLQDRRFSSDSRRPNFTELTPTLQSQAAAPPFVRTDNPDHRRLRGTIAREFLPKHIELLRPAIREIVQGVLDGLAETAPPQDMLEAFAVPVASATVFRLLGIPAEDRALLTRCVKGVVSAVGSEDEGAEVFRTLGEYIGGLVQDPSALPEDSLIRRLVEGPYQEKQLTFHETIGVILMLIVGGYDTTASTISLSLVSYALQPEKFSVVHEHPERIPLLVEELLRYHTVSQLGLGRIATEDVEVGGVTVRAGQMVVAALPLANRDESVFPNPDELDFDRPSVPHVGFGYGPHQCVGQALARVELQEAIPAVIRRLPGMRLACALEDLPFRHDMATYGIHELPMTW
ncbi:thaxtomin biosynthesis cytochrome P450 TxtC [Streptomyces europaeiscabiei]|uniref:thaxtomin biosynthesis cytochrome P450 TxtC n=1 Tax=Streptomyces TaxID=1883 RepID=UPI0006283F46|nr:MULTISPECIES: cytochrome P450 [Streptomyces]MBP5891238.1 cytochrome P450 [Streptomyces sp. LBUM 1481]MBP5921391.1 cytochrome P450 [Streptomyces sp. LBUM 1483]MDX2525921.1 cytochrome P450 [Streptomyces europaeiscabiei]MDX2687257.1 cytochrome P450 [Streptomyces scabiei]MDX2752220.1 cytochrome P450 [Streptomyces scabiei]